LSEINIQMLNIQLLSIQMINIQMLNKSSGHKLAFIQDLNEKNI